MNEELWQRLLYHPDEDRMLSQLLATLAPSVSVARAKLPKDLGLKRKQQKNVLTDQDMVCKAFAYGIQVFGLATPDVYLAPEAPGDVEVANVRGVTPGVPTLVVGRKLIEAESDIELAFAVGKTLASIRPDHLLRWPAYVPTVAELEVVVRAAIRLVDPERPIPPEITSAVEQYAAFLAKTLPPQVVEQLTVFVRRLAASYGGDTGALSAALPRWARAAYLTTIRAGLLLAGDLEIAARLAQASAVAVGIESGDVLRDLCAWSVSESYFDLRAQLGLRTVNLGYTGG